MHQMSDTLHYNCRLGFFNLRHLNSPYLVCYFIFIVLEYVCLHAIVWNTTQQTTTHSMT
jgi:hypothetical protein